MGAFRVDIEVSKPSDEPDFRRADGLLVDTGSEMTWIAADTLREAGVVVRKASQPFVMANGQTITRDVGYGLLRCPEFETVDEVVFAGPDDLKLLGARTLEGFSAVPDGPRLVEAGPIPAARSGTFTPPTGQSPHSR